MYKPDTTHTHILMCIYIYYIYMKCLRTSDLDILFFLDEKGTKVMFDGSDKPRLALAHTITKVHLNKRNISQPERMIQFEFPYILYIHAYTHLQPSSHRAPPNPDLWMLG